MIQWQPKQMKISDLKPATYNPRVTNKKAKRAYLRNVENTGDIEPIVVNIDGTIIGGFQRYMMFIERGMTDCEVFIPERKLELKEEKELNIKLNSITGYTNAKKLLDIGITQNMLDDMGFREFRMPVIKTVDKPVVEIHKIKNASMHAFFYETEDIIFVKKIIKRVIREQKTDGIDGAVAYLFQNCYE